MKETLEVLDYVFVHVGALGLFAIVMYLFIRYVLLPILVRHAMEDEDEETREMHEKFKNLN